MALSPNYSWAEPDNSNLVKNGAADIRTLGDAIDTSVWNIGYGQAGKNKIINGDFGIWQRGTSGFGVGGSYNADRFLFYADGSGVTQAITQQTFTPGTAPLATYESQFFWRYACTVAGTGATERSFYQRIEDVRTFAGQTVTFSFFAKADASRTLTLSLTQDFGSGGSSRVVTSLTSQAVTTSWARYSATVAVPSISGKTVGTSSYLQANISFPVNVTETIDIWGVQLEYGSKATPFETATGTIQGELAACQRYYYRIAGNASYNPVAFGYAYSTTQVNGFINFPVTMRTAPTSMDYTNLVAIDGVTVYSSTATAMGASTGTTNGVRLDLTGLSGLTQYRPYSIQLNNSSSQFIGFSSEL